MIWLKRKNKFAHEQTTFRGCIVAAAIARYFGAIIHLDNISIKFKFENARVSAEAFIHEQMDELLP